MTDKFRRVFGTGQPIIAMVHLGALAEVLRVADFMRIVREVRAK